MHGLSVEQHICRLAFDRGGRAELGTDVHTMCVCVCVCVYMCVCKCACVCSESGRSHMTATGSHTSAIEANIMGCHAWLHHLWHNNTSAQLIGLPSIIIIVKTQPSDPLKFNLLGYKTLHIKVWRYY